jgi:predicted RNA binding protein YcfA (HicA-like mRNA interferase family)
MNAREVLKALKADGWIELRSKGSHLMLKHPTKRGLVTLPMHGARHQTRHPGIDRTPSRAEAQE